MTTSVYRNSCTYEVAMHFRYIICLTVFADTQQQSINHHLHSHIMQPRKHFCSQAYNHVGIMLQSHKWTWPTVHNTLEENSTGFFSASCGNNEIHLSQHHNIVRRSASSSITGTLKMLFEKRIVYTKLLQHTYNRKKKRLSFNQLLLYTAHTEGSITDEIQYALAS